MCERKAKALYDYNPRSSEEIKFFENEILIILDLNIGEGWSKGRNSRNEEGLIPSNYYELMSSCEPAFPTDNNEPDKDSSDSDWSESEVTESVQRVDSQISLPVDVPRKGSNIKMPSSFSKKRNQNFLFCEKTEVAEIEAEVELFKEGAFEVYQWKQLGDYQTCNIESYKIDSKYKGIKIFVNYELVSSYSKTNVKRRYKQFHWLYTQLVEKYPCIVIPPIPCKQLSGILKREFIEGRKILLQHWLNHIIDHPVLSNSNAIKLFFSESLKKKWKIGKTKIKNDEFKNGEFYNVVKAPTDGLDIPNTFEHLNKMTLFIDEFNEDSCILLNGFRRFHSHQIESICEEYRKIGKKILKLTESLSINPDQNQNSQDLTHGLDKIGNAYNEIGSLFENQAKIDSNVVEPNLGEINVITKEIPSILELSKCTLSTLNSFNKKDVEPKLDEETLKNVEKNVEIVTRTVDAELHWLQNRRQQQMKFIMNQHLKNQIELFTKITSILSDTFKVFDG